MNSQPTQQHRNDNDGMVLDDDGDIGGVFSAKESEKDGAGNSVMDSNTTESDDEVCDTPLWSVLTHHCRS